MAQHIGLVACVCHKLSSDAFFSMFLYSQFEHVSIDHMTLLKHVAGKISQDTEHSENYPPSEILQMV